MGLALLTLIGAPLDLDPMLWPFGLKLEGLGLNFVPPTLPGSQQRAQSPGEWLVPSLGCSSLSLGSLVFCLFWQVLRHQQLPSCLWLSFTTLAVEALPVCSSSPKPVGHTN